MAVKFIDGVGSISVGKKQIMQCTDLSLSFSTATEETSSFDSGFAKSYVPTWNSWTADASFIYDTSTAGFLTGSTSSPTGGTNGYNLLEQIKLRGTPTLIIKLDTANFQSGAVVITSVDLKASSGKFQTGSVKFQGSGILSKLVS